MQGVFNPNILIYHPPNSAEGLHFSAFHFTIINCDFSAIQSTIGACERYFVSLHEDFKRSVKGVKDKHQVRQGRLRRKKQVLKLL